jgi:thioredoxin-like negative regulator of GroEL
MINFRKIAFAFAFAFGLASVNPALAADTRKFDDATFAAAQAQGRPILIDVKAWWCPVCASQNRTIERETAATQYNNLLILNVNYDKQKDVMRRFNVTKQATLIGFNGSRQTGRLDFVTDRARIAALLTSTLR